MKRNKLTMVQWLVWIGLCAALVAGCMPIEDTRSAPPRARGGPATSTPVALDSDATSLQQALAYLPVGSGAVLFTDWEVLKQIAGVADLTSAAEIDARVAFLLPLGRTEQALVGGLGVMYYRTHAEYWGWDSTDLQWEVQTATPAGPLLYTLRFRENFDFSPLLERFEAYGYHRTELDGIPLYSHALDLSQLWQRTTEFAILNVAVVAEERVLILSSAPDAVQDALAARASGVTLAQDAALASVASTLGRVGGAILEPMGCMPVDPATLFFGAQLSPETIAAQLDEWRGYGMSGLYTASGIGYRPPSVETPALGVVVYHYPAAVQAEADMEPRRTAAQRGTSLRTQRPYAELFEVYDATVERVGAASANLVLALVGRERPPQIVFDLYLQRDMLFALCGSF